MLVALERDDLLSVLRRKWIVICSGSEGVRMFIHIVQVLYLPYNCRDCYYGAL